MLPLCFQARRFVYKYFCILVESYTMAGSIKHLDTQFDKNSVDTDQQYIIKKSDFLCFSNCFKSSTKVNVNWIPFALAGIH
jgi:hypothetical protein